MLNPVSETLLSELRATLPGAAFAPDVRPYLSDLRSINRGRAAAVLRPGSVEEVAAIVRLASAARVGIVPYGGGTGLVSGHIATEEPAPLVVSLERMNRCRAAYPRENVAVVEAGVILA